jgi:hypothetical protein
MFTLPDDEDSEADESERDDDSAYSGAGESEFSGLGGRDDGESSLMSGMTGDDTVGNRSHVVASGRDSESDDDSAPPPPSSRRAAANTRPTAQPSQTPAAVGLEWTMRTTGGDSRDVADSLVQVGSIATENSGATFQSFPCFIIIFIFRHNSVTATPFHIKIFMIYFS